MAVTDIAFCSVGFPPPDTNDVLGSEFLHEAQSSKAESEVEEEEKPLQINRQVLLSYRHLVVHDRQCWPRTIEKYIE